MNKSTPLKQSSITTKTLASSLYAKSAIPLILGLLGFSLGFFSLGYLSFIHHSPKVVPYIVSIDRQGAIISSHEVKSSSTLPENAVAAFMCEFIENLNTICLDPQLQREFIHKVYACVAMDSQALHFLDNHYNHEQLFSGDKNLSQSVNIESVSRLSERSFQVDYEVIYEHFDEILRKKYKAVISYQTGSIDFDSVDKLRLNPLSIMIYDLKILKKIVKETEHV